MANKPMANHSGARLQGKVCLVTGGAAGIGRATAHKFHQEGGTVVICDLNRQKGEALVAELGGDAAYFHVDVTARDQVEEWIEAVYQRFQAIDVLVNNAGIVRDAQLVKMEDGRLAKQMTPEEFDSVIDVNMKGVFNCTQVAVPHMINRQAGVILNASSVAALDGNFGQTNYVASKSAVTGMTKVWARELGSQGIRVNAVSPGFIDTDMTAAMPDKIRDRMAAHAPLQRLGRPEDVAQAYTFLASDEAAFITGNLLRVDGGLVIGT